MKRALLCCLTLAVASSLPAQTFSAADLEFFENKVRPVLASSCFPCHSSKATTAPANLRLDSRARILRGGDSGPAAVPGQPAASRLVQAIRHEGAQMPPSGKLKEEQIAALTRWVELGLPWPIEAAPAADSVAVKAPRPPHWAWQPLVRTAPPAVIRTAWPKDDIDHFILAKLEANQLAPSVAADRRTLLRRLSYDLIGLPPTYEEVQAFERDPSPLAYERQVDRLLASPHFGERWGRHWLDVARYSDSGVLGRRFPLAITYRDWIIDAFNRDVPYDRFVALQLAADQLDLHGRNQDLAALGFISVGVDLKRPTDLPDRADDRIDVVSRGLLGLTVSCARCHDHKYDPIPTRDYYSLFGVFANTNLFGDAALVGKPQPGYYDQRIAQRQRDLEEYKRERIAEIRADFRQPAELERYRKAALEAAKLPASRRDAYAREHNLHGYVFERWIGFVQSQGDKPAVGAVGDPTEIPLSDFELVMTEGDSNTVRELNGQWGLFVGDAAWRGAQTRVTSVTDMPTLRPAHVLVRGNQNELGEQVEPCFLTVLSGADRPCFKSGSGRAELAQAIFSGRVPIAGRVIANRIWQHLFGEGIVRSVSDFGYRGDLPTHPELLDYLADEFRRDQWSMKRFIRRLVLTATYQQSSAGASEKDTENRLLSRMNRRRLDFESLRDSMLQAAGKLDTTLGGRPISITAVPADGRRTLYAYIERERPLPLLKVFDFADPEQHTPTRQSTTVPQQALYLMNSPFLNEMAAGAAASGTDANALFRRILVRDATPEELALTAPLLSTAPVITPSLDRSAWRYGTVDLDVETGRVREFRPFRYFTGTAWQAASLLPDSIEGAASLNANGGAPGDDQHHAVARRWIAPDAMEVRISGMLTHGRSQFMQRFGWSNGIRGWIVSSRQGVLGKWVIDGPKASKTVKEFDRVQVDTSIERVAVQRGDVIDFIVDSREDYESDNFEWAPKIESLTKSLAWDAARDFAGPSSTSLSPRARVAQVLLMSNEFAFID